jgi:hypothetical protein
VARKWRSRCYTHGMDVPLYLTEREVWNRAGAAELAGDTGERCFLCGDCTCFTPSTTAHLCRACYRWYISDDEYEV